MCQPRLQVPAGTTVVGGKCPVDNTINIELQNGTIAKHRISIFELLDNRYLLGIELRWGQHTSKIRSFTLSYSSIGELRDAIANYNFQATFNDLIRPKINESVSQSILQEMETQITFSLAQVDEIIANANN